MSLLRQSPHRMVIRHHPRIGHLFVANLRARIPTEWGGHFVRTNSQGFRSDLEFTPRTRGRPRILFLGDSITAGDGCNNEERFSERVGEALGAEVFNYALSGSGTDQQLLIFEQFAKGVEADLVVLCVFVENMERIKVAYRESIDRVSGRRILVPKPYFTLEGGELRLHNVPVPTERPQPGAVDAARYQAKRPGRLRLVFRLLDFYRRHPAMAGVRRVAGRWAPGLRSLILRASGFQPYPDYRSAESPGWRLMKAVLERFIRQASPTPVLLVPIPSYFHFGDGVAPIYQPLFESLADPQRGVHVMDLTTPMRRLPRAERDGLVFWYDKTHFTPRGHRFVAERIVEEIGRRGLVRMPPATAAAGKPVHVATPKPTYILGISAFYHNSAAALVCDGRIVAAGEEERFSRVKNDRRFPHFSVNYCLEEGGIHPRELAAVVYYDNASLTFERLLHTLAAVGEHGEDSWLRAMPSWVQYKLHLPRLIRRSLAYEGLVLQEVHHRSHAAAAFYPSPYDRAAILTIDGVGEWATASIGAGDGDRIHLIKEMHFPHSLGLLYSAFTQFTGFKVNSGEYKMMGLAPYGEPRYVDAILEHLVHLKDDGSLELNLDYFGYLSRPSMTNERFAQLFGGPARRTDDRITQREMDLARSVQWVTEESMLRMARTAHRLTGESRLALSGGVALNCVANGRILREGPFEDLWIQPAAGDAGSALGAALDAYHNYFGKPRPPRANGRPLQGGSYWGPEFSHDEITAYLESHGYPYRTLAPGERPDAIARLLEEGKVVGHFDGRVEFGPRALGARSILGDARNQDMQANLNLKIKYRESFRPFAPSVLAERVGDYFELDRESPYMLLVAPVRQERRLPFERGSGDDMLPIVRKARSDVPAITHVDYSARIQTVAREDAPAYHELIGAFERRTGCGVIVNTSFNVRGEPIVCTPHDAYRCFMRTEMDALVLGNCLLMKGDQPSWPEAKGHVEEDEPVRPVQGQEAMLAALRGIWARDFLPAAESLRGRGLVRVGTQLRKTATTWEDVGVPETREAIFAVPADADAARPDPERMAAALVRSWTPGPATDALRPVLVRLIRLGLRFPPRGAFEEEVPDSIYVLF